MKKKLSNISNGNALVIARTTNGDIVRILTPRTVSFWKVLPSSGDPTCLLLKKSKITKSTRESIYSDTVDVLQKNARDITDVVFNEAGLKGKLCKIADDWSRIANEEDCNGRYASASFFRSRYYEIRNLIANI